MIEAYIIVFLNYSKMTVKNIKINRERERKSLPVLHTIAIYIFCIYVSITQFYLG